MINILSEPTRGAVTPPLSDLSASTGRASTELLLPVHLKRQLEIVVEASYPYEACGVMIGRSPEGEPSKHGEGRRVVVEDAFHARNLNVGRARDRFLLDPEDHLAAEKVARQRGLEVVGFWHSHPDHPARPSATDLEAAWEGYSYLIVSHPAFGANELRSWRLRDGEFVEEKLRQVAGENARS